MEPLVSVCTPVYNGGKYLANCCENILAQTCQDWEHVLVNNCSTDGTLAIAQKYAALDRRIRICNNERFVSVNENWNNAFRQARGRYVYGLSCDDFVARDFLETLAPALEARPDCGIAHARLRLINEDGGEAFDWWSKDSAFARSSPGLLDRKHIRLAPFDGLLHLAGDTVYITFSQLLIRRSLFDRIGLLESRWGSMGDFNWYMRVALVSNTVHVPGTWGGWRIHPAQASSATNPYTSERCQKITEMIDDALQRSEKFLAEPVRRGLQAGWLEEARDLRETAWQLHNLTHDTTKRRIFLLRRLLAGSWVAREHVKARLRGGTFRCLESAPKLIEKWLGEAGIGPCVVPL